MGKGGRHSKHRQSLVTLSRRHSMVQMLDNLELDGPSPLRLHHPPVHAPLPAPMSTSSKVCKLLQVLKEFISNLYFLYFQMLRRASLDDLEQSSCQLAPTIQHRIVKVQNDDHLQQMILRREAMEKTTEVIKEMDETSPQ